MPDSLHALSPLAGQQAQDVAVVIVAHGDRGGSGNGSTVVRNQALERHRAHLEASQTFAAVTAGVLKGSPTFEDAVAEACDSGPKAVAIYPFFMADGYFVKTVVPKRLALCGLDDLPHDILKPLGLAPELVDIIVAQAGRSAVGADIDPKQSRLMLVGHGSKYGPASAAATRRAADRLAQHHAGVFADVEVAFLEEAPFLSDQLTDPQRPTIVSGFFNGDGLHAGEDVPAALKDAAGQTAYTGPVGTTPDVSDLIQSEILAALTNPAPQSA